MIVDGRIVGRALSARIKPVLKDLGFDRFQGRHCWRRNESTVDLVTLPSMSAYIAHSVGCTSFSFGCEAGVYYPQLVLDREPVEWPRDYELTFRGIAHKTIRQPIFHPWGERPHSDQEWRRDRADTWYVLEDGSNLDEVVEDALSAVERQAIPFIQLNNDPEQALHSLQTRPLFADSDLEDRNQNFGVMHNFAATIGSPDNVRLIQGLTALLAARG